jgi:multiple sugar transport system ATP-binding protein
MSGINLVQVTKVYPNGVKAINNVDLEIADGEFMVLVGPSGCGKSTLLRSIAGLEDITAGSIIVGDVDVSDMQPQRRDIAMVFQNYALYPHMTVRGNLEYGLKIRKLQKEDRDKRVAEVSKILGLEDLLDRKPAALSGGQRQRVAMGRAIVREPQAFLMDEPLSNLDAKLRVSMRAELSRLHDRLGVTTVYVTHDQVEAMTLGQRVAVLRDGILQQVDTPERLYEAPVNLFVAAFIGSPSMNLVEAEVRGGAVHFAGFQIPLSAPVDAERVVVGMRPSDLVDSVDAPADQPRLKAEVQVVEKLGSETHILFAIDAPRVNVDAVRAASDDAAADLFTEDRAVFTSILGGRRQVAVGDHVDLAVDPQRLYLFDLATGDRLGAAPTP